MATYEIKSNPKPQHQLLGCVILLIIGVIMYGIIKIAEGYV